MTRPMPGPPKCTPDASPHESVPFNGGDYYRCERHEPRVRYRKSKRLSDTECAAEYWRAGWIASLDFHDEHEADEASTWHRFATHPHAFKENHNDRP